jgi:hypothetical protein
VGSVRKDVLKTVIRHEHRFSPYGAGKGGHLVGSRQDR